MLPQLRIECVLPVPLEHSKIIRIRSSVLVILHVLLVNVKHRLQPHQRTENVATVPLDTSVRVEPQVAVHRVHLALSSP
jgi:hypothetical protein